MSQRFVVIKGPKGLAFQIQADDLSKFKKLCADARPQHSAPPRRKKTNVSWRSKDESDDPDGSRLAFPKRLDPSSINSNKVNLRKIAPKNVLIDSYYPKLLGDLSEDCSRKTRSSSEELKKLRMVNASESDSKKTYDAMKNICGRPNPKFVSVVFKDNGSKDSDRVTLQKSSRSRLTLNCNTYTLISMSSELESLASGNHRNAYDGVTKKSSKGSDELQEVAVDETRTWLKEEEIRNLVDCGEGSRDALSTTECFAHLYNRIETLEELLQQTLVNSVEPKEEYDCLEKPEAKQKPQPGKNKFAVFKVSELKNHLTNGHRVRETYSAGEATEGKENSDTENELQNIKKRLNALERRLREARNSVALRGEAVGQPTVNNDSNLSEADEKSNGRPGTRELVKPKKDDFRGKLFSQTTFVVPSELLVFSTTPEIKPEKNWASGDTRKKISKCKKIKRKTSSIFNPRRKTFRSKKPPLKMPTDRSKPHSILKENPSQSGFLSSSSAVKKFENDPMSDVKLEETTILTSQLVEKPKKKHRNKRNSLCKKTSIMNMILGQGEQTKRNVGCERVSAGDGPTEFKENPWTLAAPKLRTNSWSPCSCWMTFSATYPSKPRRNSFLRRSFQFNDEVEGKKTSKPQPSSADPIEILKGGGKIRIPVLFEEVCKRSSSKTLGRNLSDVSMRFVLVQEDPKHPLRKLIKKFARNPNQKTENYLFGVSKCSCNTQMPHQREGNFSKEKKTKMKTVAENLSMGLSPLNLTILALVLFLGGHYWRRRSFYKLAAMIDGPKPLPLIGNAMEYLALDHVKILDYLLEITTKYKGLAKVWLGGLLLVHVSNPEDVEILLSSHKLIEKNRMYRFFDDVLGQGLLNARGDVWKKHRKIIAPTFHPSILKHFVKIFSEQSKILVKVLEKNADGRIFNVFPYVRNCALDFITETALENHIGAQLRVVAPATRAAERLMNITYNRMFKLWLYSDFIFYRTQQGKEYLRLRDLVKESTEPLLEVKKKEVAEQDQNRNNTENVKRKSFFRQLVELNENAENFNDKELRDEVVTMIITGYETTAATVGFILVMLGIHQDIQARVYEEVLAVQELAKGRELEAEDLNRFEYMDRVIKETLRLYPVGPIIFRECTTDVKLTTCTIPKGASVAVVILKTHRDPAIWENPEKFDPDHFLPEKCEKRHPYAYIPFSAGPRNCIGKQYAYLSMRVMLYHILSNYKVLCDLRNEDIKIKSEVTMKMVGGFKIRLLPRQKVKVN